MGEVVKIALIPPISLLGQTAKTDYQLCLPHLMRYTEYRNIYSAHCADPNQFVILDNGAAENELFGAEQLLDIALVLGVDEVVIPDVMLEADATIEKAQEFHDFAIGPKGREKDRYPFQYMFVVQGKSLMQVLECANWAAQQSWIDTIGIPRHLLTTLGDLHCRVKIANVIQGHNYSKQIHFLGGNPAFPQEVSLLSDPIFTTQDRIRGMDTSMPFNYAFEGALVSDRKRDPISRPGRYFELHSISFEPNALEANVEYFTQFHSAGVGAE